METQRPAAGRFSTTRDTSASLLATLWPDLGSRAWRDLVTLSVTAGLIIAAILTLHVTLLTPIGYGLATYKSVLPYHASAATFQSLGALTLVLAYIYDFSLGSVWPNDLDGVRILVIAALIIFFGVSSFLSLSTSPASAHAFVLLLLPISLTALKRYLWPKPPLLPFLRILSYELSFAGADMIIFWLFWLPRDSSDAKYEQTLSYTYMWFACLVSGLFCLFMAAASWHVSNSEDARGRSGGSSLLTLLLSGFLILSFSSAQLSLANMELASRLQMVCAVGLVLSLFAPCIVLGWEETVCHPRVLAWLETPERGDWLRAALFSFASPIYVFGFLPLSVLNQAARTRFWLLAPPPACSETAWFGWFTPIVAEQVLNIFNWNWTSVLVKSGIISIVTFCIIVCLQSMMTIFLGWFIAQLADIEPWATVLVFTGTCAGLLFLNPWLPGVPIYFAGGVAISAAFRNTVGFWGAVCVACIFSFLTKYISLVALYTCLGLRWRRDAAVRHSFGLRTLQMRALGSILHGSLNNVTCFTILVAGPDWPVAVFAGMLGVPLRKVLAMQTIPCLLFIVLPATIAGAALHRQRDSKHWSIISTCLLISAAAIQGIGMLTFNFSVARYAHEHEADLMSMRNDREVEELEEIFEATEAPLLRDHDTEMNWHEGSIGLRHKIILVIGSVSFLAACTLLRFASSSCFATIQLNDSIRCPATLESMNPRLPPFGKCFHANVDLLIFPSGWAVFCLIGIGLVCFKVIGRWSNSLLDQKRIAAALGPELLKTPSFSRKRFVSQASMEVILKLSSASSDYMLT